MSETRSEVTTVEVDDDLSPAALLALARVRQVAEHRAAADLLDDFEAGVTFVPLAPVRDPARVMPVVAQALGLQEAPGRSPLDALCDHLRRRVLLLLLDNFEQVHAAVTRTPARAAMAAAQVRNSAHSGESAPVIPVRCRKAAPSRNSASKAPGARVAAAEPRR